MSWIRNTACGTTLNSPLYSPRIIISSPPHGPTACPRRILQQRNKKLSAAFPNSATKSSPPHVPTALQTIVSCLTVKFSDSGGVYLKHFQTIIIFLRGSGWGHAGPVRDGPGSVGAVLPEPEPAHRGRGGLPPGRRRFTPDSRRHGRTDAGHSQLSSQRTQVKIIPCQIHGDLGEQTLVILNSLASVLR